MTLGDIIRDYRVQNGMSMQDFAALSGLSRAYISILERNVNPSTKRPPIPSLHTIQAAASAMGCDVNQLIATMDANQPVRIYDDVDIDNASPIHRIPILGRVAAGLPLYADEQIIGYTVTTLNSGAEYFALRVQGDSMDALGIRSGDDVIVRKQDYADDGQVAVVLVDGEDATIKRIYRSGTTVTLMPQSTNPAHRPQIYDASRTQIRIIGVVVQSVITIV